MKKALASNFMEYDVQIKNTQFLKKQIVYVTFSKAPGTNYNSSPSAKNVVLL